MVYGQYGTHKASIPVVLRAVDINLLTPRKLLTPFKDSAFSRVYQLPFIVASAHQLKVRQARKRWESLGRRLRVRLHPNHIRMHRWLPERVS